MAAISQAEAELGSAQRIVYLAQVVIEKPFGHDLDSAHQLDAALHEVFQESQIFRIDHFLGKQGVQNILALRFANGLLEPAWHAEHLDYVQIDVPEQLTIAGRGAFYEPTGAFRTWSSRTCSSCSASWPWRYPPGFDATCLRREKLKVFQAMELLDPARVVFGQYDGYRFEPGVAAESNVETFVAAEVAIDNRRWAGVPFYVRTGKALTPTRSLVTLGFKRSGLGLFGLSPEATDRLRPNELVFDLADPGGVTVAFSAKKPGPAMALGPASSSFRYADSFTAANDLEAYERLLHDVMLGDPPLFNDAAGIERLWQVAAPLLQAPSAPLRYPQGSWGPQRAVEFIAPHRWHLPEPSTGHDQGAAP